MSLFIHLYSNDNKYYIYNKIFYYFITVENTQNSVK